MVIMRSRFDRVKSRGFQFPYFPVWFSRSGALLRHAATPPRLKTLTLTLVSYVFYGWWNPWFLPLMLLSTAIDYASGEAIVKPGQSQGRRKVALWTSIISNLSILGLFNYAILFAETTLWIAAH